MNPNLNIALLDDLMTKQEAASKAESIVRDFVISARKTDIQNVEILQKHIEAQIHNLVVVIVNSGIDPDLLVLCQKSLTTILSGVASLKKSHEVDLAVLERDTLKGGRLQ